MIIITIWYRKKGSNCKKKDRIFIMLIPKDTCLQHFWIFNLKSVKSVCSLRLDLQ